MKIFSVKRALGLAAIYGAVQYARKNGGFAKVFEDLKTKAMDLKDQAQQSLGQVGQKQNTMETSATEPSTTGYGTTSGYGGSYTGGYGNGFGGGSTNRH